MSATKWLNLTFFRRAYCSTPAGLQRVTLPPRGLTPKVIEIWLFQSDEKPRDKPLFEIITATTPSSFSFHRKNLLQTKYFTSEQTRSSLINIPTWKSPLPETTFHYHIATKWPNLNNPRCSLRNRG